MASTGKIGRPPKPRKQAKSSGLTGQIVAPISKGAGVALASDADRRPGL